MVKDRSTGRKLSLPTQGDGEGNGTDAVINTVFYIVVTLIFLLIGWGIWRVWDTATSPIIALKKSEWTCTDIRKRYFRQVGRYGNIHAWVTNTCWQYSKIDAQGLGAANQ
ncbi:MAG: hypothetical protein P4L73_16925 [Caulobacteraceae bacterium]|nr:hypothetical protein [Caulobacteraceae bacterium]